MKDVIEFLNRQIAYYQSSREITKDIDELLVCRADGVILFKELQQASILDTIGALVVGMWQAAKVVQTEYGLLHEHGFSLQFSSSQEGIIIFPLKLSNQELILTVLFKDELHPGRLKNRCRFLRDSLENDFLEFKGKVTKVIEEERKDFLFDNISDKEIDNLFSFAGI